MTNQQAKAETFRRLHIACNPLILTNVWDAGSALAVAKAGAPAIATGSASVAGAQGYDDGEDLPFDRLVDVVQAIVHVVDQPLSVDIETGYADDLESLAENVGQIIEAGAIGINIEDRRIDTAALRPVDEHAARIRAVRAKADALGMNLFINARTDVFLNEPDASKHASDLSEAQEREAAYAEAGASGFFVPGLADHHLIRELTSNCKLPINVMDMGNPVEPQPLAELGVARISAGPAPFRRALGALRQEAAAALG